MTLCPLQYWQTVNGTTVSIAPHHVTHVVASSDGCTVGLAGGLHVSLKATDAKFVGKINQAIVEANRGKP